jgi:hypothetical protein
MDLVPVTSVNDTGLANVIVGVLEQAGIEAMVREADADRARDVLAQYETMPEEEDEDA